MKTLSFPAFDYRVKRVSGRLFIFDVIRKKHVLLTPEEWVRQHVIHFLMAHRGFPAGGISVEKEVEVCGLKQRFDLLCHDRLGRPFLIVECKAPSVKLSEKVFDQAFCYNRSLMARFVLVTNGYEYYCGEILPGPVFQLLPDIPFLEE